MSNEEYFDPPVEEDPQDEHLVLGNYIYFILFYFILHINACFGFFFSGVSIIFEICWGNYIKYSALVQWVKY